MDEEWAWRGWQNAQPTTTANPVYLCEMPRTAKFSFAAMPVASRLSVLAALRSRGLWGKSDPYSILPKRQRLDSAERTSSPGAVRTSAALSIWRCASSPDGTPVETYLRSRALRLPLPPTLRFHQGLKHPEGAVWPAMVSLVTRGHDDTPTGIHRTYLSPDGRSKAEVQTPKMMLGPCRGGGVRLAIATNVVMVGEGEQRHRLPC